MSEAVDLRLIGKLLRDVQAEQRTLITRLDLLQGLILENVVTALLNRIAAAEALSETRFDAVLQRLDQSERSLDERRSGSRTSSCDDRPAAFPCD